MVVLEKLELKECRYVKALVDITKIKLFENNNRELKEKEVSKVI